MGRVHKGGKGHFMSAPITKTCVTTNYLLTREEMRKQIQGHGWNHYVYGLCHTSGIVFYIGKGRGFRALTHEDEASSDDSIKSQAIRLCDDQLRYTLFACCADDAYAAGIEAYLIRTHKDQLSNIANGSEAAIDRMFQPVDQITKDRETLAQIARYLQRADEECREAMKGIIRGCPEIEQTLTEEERQWVNEGYSHV